MGYFRNLPDILYQSPLPHKVSTQEFIQIKNIFRRSKVVDYVNDNITLFSVLGNSIYNYRQTPADQKANFSMNFDYMIVNGFEYTNDKIGNFHMLFMLNQISSLGSNLSYYEFTDYTSKNNEINIIVKIIFFIKKIL